MKIPEFKTKICVECGKIYQCCYSLDIINYICNECEKKKTSPSKFDKMTFEEKFKWLSDQCSK